MVFSRYLETGTEFLNNFVTKRVWNHKIVYNMSGLFFKLRIQDGSLLSKKLKTFFFKQNDFQTIWIVLIDINKKRLTLLKSRKRFNLLNLYLRNDQFLLHTRKEYIYFILWCFKWYSSIRVLHPKDFYGRFRITDVLIVHVSINYFKKKRQQCEYTNVYIYIF